MKISENWLNEWVNNDLTTDELMAQLTMLGLEVDGVEPAAGVFSNVVVAEIISCEKHPDADKLKVCQVNAGTETVQIVCGAPNARTGLKTALSQIGAVLPGNFKIKKSKLRGVESHGMLCSEVELGLSQESDGIIELPADAPVGADVAEYLQTADQIIDIDLTPNRADCFCISGVAREVAAMNGLTQTPPCIDVVTESISDQVNVQMKAVEQCPVYISRVVKGINNQAVTPLWMKEKLRRTGVKSIHPVVDVTNFVMMELGQPMHAFDKSNIEGDLVVRMAKKDEGLVLLDESEAKLTPEFIVIADEKKALAVAGVMGGLHSGVTAETKDIVLESAYFDPATIMGKSRKLGVHTESALRFERGVDVALQAQAMARATQLIVEICGGEVAPMNVNVDEANVPASQTITLTAVKLKRVLGFDVADERVTAIFEGLGLVTTFDNDTWTVETPSWRFDLAIAEDLIEEVVRVVGYDQMPALRLHSTDAIRVIPEQMRQDKQIKAHLADLGYQEVINYAFVPEKQLQDLGVADGGIALANPLNKDMAVMRTQLLGGVLQNIKSNLARQSGDLSLFEMGKVFVENKAIQQKDYLLMARCGMNRPEQWGEASRKVDFYDMKGEVESLLGKTALLFEVSEEKYLHPGRQAQVTSEGEVLGYVGQVHPSICQKLKIKQDVLVAVFDVAAIKSISLPQWEAVSKFPSVRRDLSIMVKEDVTWYDVQSAVRKALGADVGVMKDLSLFDVYQGEHIESGCKSLAMALIFQENNRTLEDKEVDNLLSKAVSYLTEHLNAELRT
ncbi:phenylalanine--tRNA ligase subunit beta [Marinicella rhabdoformis]|uniref:phenylalanine--tRNA ligase subunit beta n=1 Tax=Marinicella rhabdoformis TaxID=2580566 RepID=UPI0012AEB6ED|nr:phenylalanine--tRNA ligase subunit beta [Marinicella rhabdoformis]